MYGFFVLNTYMEIITPSVNNRSYRVTYFVEMMGMYICLGTWGVRLIHIKI